ncbi:Alpha-humulene/(-)-(E)-beta-caryophyllene synthase [Zea mays]|uniref:Alpha-humulene/(-)-(E)-beta-caryophyllene synthase n=1 Tax=Zea mays TaxID=4577 RepID=A0A1D6J0W8_MAIZE|nr:Alpha-humulene/(-)-(E)-beta-caryophyllene synthase [Zea mays]
MTTSVPVPLASQPQAPQRKPRTYTPSPWGDFFLHHTPCTPSQLLSMKERAKVKEQQVRQIIQETMASSNLLRKLELVDTLQRLGVDYRYYEEIDQLLRSVYDDGDKDGGGSDDLYLTSLRFYLLRKHGYTTSSDVFEKFRDERGSVSSDDASCLLMLYDAAHTRTHGEEILDDIIAWSKSRLQSLLEEKNLEPELAEEVRCALETPRFRRVKRVEARRYISAYEKKGGRDGTILEFAKLDYNISQAIYCDELKELTVWDEQIAHQLSAGLKVLLASILNATNKIEEELKLQGNMHAELVKKMVIDTAKSYHAEVKWRDEHFVPATVEDHLQISIPSSGCMQITNLALISSRGNMTTREDVEWVFTFPKIVRGACIVGRICNDIMSHEREQASLDHVASTVQTCMKQYGVTTEEANEKLRAVIEMAWMDIVQDNLEQERPIALLDTMINVARIADFIYKREDAYTLSFSLKGIIGSMYVYSV